MKIYKNLSVIEKIAFAVQILCLVAILVLIGFELFTEGRVDPIALPLVCSFQMLTSAVLYWRTQKGLAKISICMGTIILICAIVIAIANRF